MNLKKKNSEHKRNITTKTKSNISNIFFFFLIWMQYCMKVALALFVLFCFVFFISFEFRFNEIDGKNSKNVQQIWLLSNHTMYEKMGNAKKRNNRPTSIRNKIVLICSMKKFNARNKFIVEFLFFLSYAIQIV